MFVFEIFSPSCDDSEDSSGQDGGVEEAALLAQFIPRDSIIQPGFDFA